ncbi:hypothetical protein [Pedobacter frigidisoli]|uniref:hypothetical protein n=1 Tax=Pedobacter frigidisoli TaxID=2530455 RepID=UPI00292D5E7F|nr:hypothetical protein [Pedobacter frigidisoli]
MFIDLFSLLIPHRLNGSGRQHAINPGVLFTICTNLYMLLIIDLISDANKSLK